MRRPVLLVVLVAAVAACDDGGAGTADAAMGGSGGGGGSGGSGGAGGSGGGSPDAGPAGCVATGGGMLTITVSGLPAGVNARVAVTAPGGAMSMVTMTETRAAVGGMYMFTAEKVAAPHAIVRTAYAPTISTTSACVRDAQTTSVTVTYAAIASSGKIWAGNSNKDVEMLAYAPAAVAASGMPMATVAARTNGSDGFTFDRDGNLWVLGATTADPPLARFAAASLGASGAKTPDVTIRSPSFGGGIPGPKVVAFDRMGNLWVSVVAGDKVIRFTPAQLAATGMPTAAVELTNVEGPSGIAFDMTGNLYVASAKKVIMKFNAARLAASTTGSDLELSMMTPAPVIGTLPAAFGLAFDAMGALWANCDGTLVRLPAADLASAAMGTVRMLTPTIQITADVLALPLGIAFDESGGLWVAYQKGQLVRLGPSQLTSSGAKTPEVIIAGPDIGYAAWFALYPAPAALPLYHSLP
jgi:hypothetical protein